MKSKGRLGCLMILNSIPTLRLHLLWIKLVLMINNIAVRPQKIQFSALKQLMKIRYGSRYISHKSNLNLSRNDLMFRYQQRVSFYQFMI